MGKTKTDSVEFTTKRSLQALSNDLRRAANALQAVQNESNSFQGETAAAIGERAEQLRRQILNLISDLEDTQNYTQRVVRRYWLLDQKWKQIFESSR